MASKQRKWQIKMKEEGRCTRCGAPLWNKNYCLDCRNKRNQERKHEKPISKKICRASQG